MSDESVCLKAGKAERKTKDKDVDYSALQFCAALGEQSRKRGAMSYGNGWCFICGAVARKYGNGTWAKTCTNANCQYELKRIRSRQAGAQKGQAMKRERKKPVKKPKKKSAKRQRDEEPRYKCMICEYVPCICSSVSIWNL